MLQPNTFVAVPNPRIMSDQAVANDTLSTDQTPPALKDADRARAPAAAHIMKARPLTETTTY